MHSTCTYNRRSALHILRDEPSQDTMLVDNTPQLGTTIFILTTGIVNNPFSKKGAEYAAKAVLNFIRENQNRLMTKSQVSITHEIISELTNSHKILSEMYEIDIRQFSSTVVAVLVDEISNKLFYISIGNSIILAVENGNLTKIASCCNDFEA